MGNGAFVKTAGFGDNLPGEAAALRWLAEAEPLGGIRVPHLRLLQLVHLVYHLLHLPFELLFLLAPRTSSKQISHKYTVFNREPTLHLSRTILKNRLHTFFTHFYLVQIYELK